MFEPGERGRAIGIWAGVSGAGIALGPVIGGFLLEHFWWGSVFLINVPFTLVGAAAIIAVVPESADPHPKRVDPLGVLLSIAGLVALVYGIIKGGETSHWTSPASWTTARSPRTMGPSLVRICWRDWRSEARASASDDSPQSKPANSSLVWGPGSSTRKFSCRRGAACRALLAHPEYWVGIVGA